MNRRFRINVLLGGVLSALIMLICRWLENRYAVPGAMEKGRYLTVVVLFATLYHYILQLRTRAKDTKLSFIRVLLSAVGFMLAAWSILVLLQGAALYLAPEYLDSWAVREQAQRAAEIYQPDQVKTIVTRLRWNEFFIQETLTLAGGLLICMAIAAIVPHRDKK